MRRQERSSRAVDSRVRSYVKMQLESYQENRKNLQAYRAALMPSSTPSYGSTGGGSGESRPTEALGIKLAADPYIAEQLRVLEIIEKVLRRHCRADQRLIELVYFKGTHTVTGAGMVVHMSRDTAYRHVNSVIDEIARGLGYIGFDKGTGQR